MGILVRNNDDFIDQLEAKMVEMDNPVECPLKHTFTKGLYSRMIFMPAGSLLTSKIHKTEHQFVVLKGKLEVSIDGQKSELIVAPYHGITKAGTRRLLFIHEDTVWQTFHATDIMPKDESEEAQMKAVKEIEDTILEKHENKFLRDKNKWSLNKQEV
jgi:hypothetical protein